MRYFILLFIFSLNLSQTLAQEQIYRGFSTAMKNLIYGDAFEDTKSNSEYEKIRKTSNDKLTNDCPGMTHCSNRAANLDVMHNLLKIKDGFCACVVWGSCPKSLCGCQNLCPNDFRILNYTGNELSTKVEDSLSFTNADSSFEKDDLSYAGYCWGHAVMTQKFNRLARFNGDRPKMYKGRVQEKERVKYYKSIIAELLWNQPVTIDGFKNLYDFSSDPEVKAILQDEVGKVWAQNAMSVQGLSIITNNKIKPKEEYNKIFDEIEKRLADNQSPVIVFNSSLDSKSAHAVLATGSGILNGKRYLCIRDNAYEPEENEQCKMKMFVENEGLSYPDTGWDKKGGKIANIVISYTENSNTVTQVNNLLRVCLVKKSCI